MNWLKGPSPAVVLPRLDDLVRHRRLHEDDPTARRVADHPGEFRRRRSDTDDLLPLEARLGNRLRACNENHRRQTTDSNRCTAQHRIVSRRPRLHHGTALVKRKVRCPRARGNLKSDARRTRGSVLAEVERARLALRAIDGRYAHRNPGRSAFLRHAARIVMDRAAKSAAIRGMNLADEMRRRATPREAEWLGCRPEECGPPAPPAGPDDTLIVRLRRFGGDGVNVR